MKPIQRVLVAVKNPDLRRQPGVDKALHIARRLGASVELFNAISTPVFLELEPLNGRSIPEIRREALALRLARLETIAKRSHKLGVETTCHVAWDFPPHEAIVRRAARIHADLIIAECHEGKRFKPWLLHLTDWELLRLSPRPVLLLKNDKPWGAPVILAAVDPSHAHAKPARLDAAIVDCATLLGKALRGSVELMHANFPASFGAFADDPAMGMSSIAQLYDQQRANSKASFQDFAAKAGIAKSRCHLVDTDPIFGIPHVARKVGASVVVMGALSRSGLKRVFIGNTAERVLEAVPCDVLVIKPVRATPRVGRVARGMRVVSNQSFLPLPI